MWPAMPENALQQAEWHVTVGRLHIARQREIIDKMRDAGMRTDLAERVLAILVGMQQGHEAHRDRLRREGPATPTPV